ncbi:hypothetical protein [Herbidospora cretacea]|uniref:hypothetical protein n=1 Tax=Herbidospora cretacea TaxID=28444 RepID=UPI000AE9558D|nr:hypothetical protein [Herbidospora cretacea]
MGLLTVWFGVEPAGGGGSCARSCCWSPSGPLPPQLALLRDARGAGRALSRPVAGSPPLGHVPMGTLRAE